MLQVRVPSSKSYAQRAIVCAMLASGKTTLLGVESCEDIESALTAVQSQGAKVERTGQDIIIEGMEGMSSGSVSVGESGLCARMFGALGVLTSGLRIEGKGTLLNRDMGGMIRSLESLGAHISTSVDNRLPAVISGKDGLNRTIEIEGSDSSQVLTGLLLALPLLPHSTVVYVRNLVSRPYIDITLDVLEWFGVEVQNIEYKEFRVRGGQHYSAVSKEIESDWSAAGYFLTMRQIYGIELEVENLNFDSLQADKAILGAFELARSGSSIEFDATHCPDLVPTLVVLCSHLSGVSYIWGLGRLANKESSRGRVLQREFAKLGVVVELDYVLDRISIHGVSTIMQSAQVDPHGDHRIAMATAIMGRDVDITDKDVVAKSFPRFWEELARCIPLIRDCSTI